LLFKKGNTRKRSIRCSNYKLSPEKARERREVGLIARKLTHGNPSHSKDLILFLRAEVVDRPRFGEGWMPGFNGDVELAIDFDN